MKKTTRKVQPMTPVAVADRFIDLLKQEIGLEKYKRACILNADMDPAANACASHDYCDANMVMLEAIGGRVPDFDSESPAEQAHLDLWCKAWAISFDRMVKDSGKPNRFERRCPDCGSTFTIDDAVTEIKRDIVNAKNGVAYTDHRRTIVRAAFCNGCERVEVL